MTRPHFMSDIEFIDHLAEKLKVIEGEEFGPLRMRLIVMRLHLPEDGLLSPWNEDRSKGVSSGWGPGTIEDYAKLSGQQPCDPEEAVDIFIKRNVPRNAHGHLLDNDDNDGEYLRRIVRKAVKRARKNGRRQGKLKAASAE